MNLISCDNCAIVLDADKLRFPKDIYTDGVIDNDKAVYNGETFVAKTQCPLCEVDILEP